MDCALAIAVENITGLYNMEGEPLDRWRRGLAASIGAVLVEDTREQA